MWSKSTGGVGQTPGYVLDAEGVCFRRIGGMRLKHRGYAKGWFYVRIYATQGVCFRRIGGVRQKHRGCVAARVGPGGRLCVGVFFWAVFEVLFGVFAARLRCFGWDGVL